MNTNIVEMNAATAPTEISEVLMNPGMLERIERFAELMASGRATVPKHLQGSVGDCLAVVMQAARWRMDPFAVAQKTHVVNGALGYEAQLVNAVVCSSGIISGRFHYEFGDDNGGWAKAGAVVSGEKQITWGEPVYANQQAVKNSPLWKTDPKQQLAYLAVKKWARLYAPGAILGIYTPDEMEERQERDMGNAVVADERPAPTRSQSVLDKARQKTGKKQHEPAVVENAPEEGISYDQLMAALANCDDAGNLAALSDHGRKLYPSLDDAQKTALTAAIKAASETE